MMTLLLLAFPAIAADLDLSIQFNDEAPFELVLSDVVERTNPSLSLPHPDGLDRQLEVEVSQDTDGQYVLAFALSKAVVDRKGRTTFVDEIRPVLRVPEGKEARSMTGMRIPFMVDDELQFQEERITITVLVSPSP